ncbi:MAG: aldehyde dehydrogenase [Actinobacteria bacterium]|nr:aldehyde dehydrogenase [Actinomycetota bacterium]
MRELRNHVGGRWVIPGDELFESTSPSTGEVVATAPVTFADGVDEAAKAARAAFEDGSWRRARGSDRGAALLALADALEEREAEVGELMAREMGKPVRIARGREVAGAVDRLRYFAGAARLVSGRFTGASVEELWDMEVPEPVGVCALIVPWNDPVDLAVRKMGAALAVGCSVVVKPSEVTPASTAVLFEIADELDLFPPGVINLIHGPGNPTGEALVGHLDVDKVSFTGSTGTGRRIMEVASRRLARVSLECGGKAPAVVFADADLDRCLDALTYGAFMYAGQSCTACTRLIVEDAVHDRVVEGIVRRSRDLAMGDPLEEATFVGPMASREQYDRAVGFLELGLSEGATAALGGEPGGDDLYLAPTVLLDVPHAGKVATEEIFGPILAVHRFSDEAEALALANGTRYGLAGSVWSQDISRALRIARRLDVADVWVNTHYVRQAETSFGGRHLSGIGRELGMAGVEEYLSWKRVCIDTRSSYHLKDWFEGGEGFRG